MASNHQTAHSVLEYLITKATIKGEPQKGKFRIPYIELLRSVGQEEHGDKNNRDIDLIIEFDLYWDATRDNQMDVELSDDLGEGE